MYYIPNRFTIYAILLLTLVMIGCDAQNPVCSDNFCVVGEVFLRSDLEANQEFSEVDVDDSKILAVLIGTPQPTTPQPDTQPDTQPETGVTLAAIVADVATNGVDSNYIDQTVTITAPIEYNFAGPDNEDNPFVTLITHDDTVSFFVSDDDGVNDLANLGGHTTYTFTLLITDVSESTTTPGDLNIWSDLSDTPAKADIEILDVTMAQIVADVLANGTFYLGKIVRLQATVSFDLLKTSGIITLGTGNTKVSFFVIDANNPQKLNPYVGNLTYTFTLYIYEISEDEDEPGSFDISAGIADD